MFVVDKKCLVWNGTVLSNYIVILLGIKMCHIIIHFTGLADSAETLNLQN